MNTSTSPTSSLTSLQAKLAAISANNEFSNKSAEEYNTPFPLSALLVIFNKAHRDCMLDYMEGFKLLNIWLSPVLSPAQARVDIAYKYPLLGSYETQRISRILGIDESIIIESMILILRKNGDL